MDALGTRAFASAAPRLDQRTRGDHPVKRYVVRRSRQRVDFLSGKADTDGRDRAGDEQAIIVALAVAQPAVAPAA